MFFFISIMGNKIHELPYIDDIVYGLIDENKIDTIVEPFCGSASFSMYFHRKYGDKLKYHINDNDPYLIEFMLRVRDGTEGSIFKFVNDNCIGLTKERFKEIITQKDLNSWFFHKKVYGYRQGLFPPTNRKYGDYNWNKYKHYYDFLRCKTLTITCNDYKNVVSQYKDDTNVLIFVDPPYLSSYNASYVDYKGSSTSDNILTDRTGMYVDIVEMMKSRCKCMSIQNENHLLRYIYKDFIKRVYRKKYKLTKNITNHLVICNF